MCEVIAVILWDFERLVLDAIVQVLQRDRVDHKYRAGLRFADSVGPQWRNHTHSEKSAARKLAEPVPKMFSLITGSVKEIK